jgi:glycosyltransferase involved in cell wall biosynthesis
LARRWSALLRRRPAAPAPLSVVIIAKDEERLILRCLEPLRFADEVLVLDSGSTDRTVELARGWGARVVDQEWLGFARQKNRAAQLTAHDWVLSLDADEIVTERLARSIRRVLDAGPDPRDAFLVDRRADFLGRKLPQGQRRARRPVRLYNRRHSAWDESMEIHERVLAPGRLRALDGELLHWNDCSLDELLSIWNRNATVEARAMLAAGRRTSAAAVVGRPVLRFLWLYLLRGEARVRGHGLVHAALKASSDFMRLAKLWELQLAERGRLPEGHPLTADRGAEALEAGARSGRRPVGA